MTQDHKNSFEKDRSFALIKTEGDLQDAEDDIDETIVAHDLLLSERENVEDCDGVITGFNFVGAVVVLGIEDLG